MDAHAANALRQQIVALDLAGCPPSEIAERAACALSTVYKVLADPHPDRRTRQGTDPSDHPHPDDPEDALPPDLPQRTIAAVRTLHAADPDRSAAEVYAILADHHAPSDPDPLPSPRTIARVLRAVRAEAAHLPTVSAGDEPVRAPAAPSTDAPVPSTGSPAPTEPHADPPPAATPGPASGEPVAFPFDPTPREVDPETASKIRHVVDDLTSSVATRLERLPDDAASLGVEVSVLRLLLRQTLAELLYAEHGPQARRRLRAEVVTIVTSLIQALRAAHTIQPRAATVAAQYLTRLEEIMG